MIKIARCTCGRADGAWSAASAPLGREVVVVPRERGGVTLSSVFRSEAEAVARVGRQVRRAETDSRRREADPSSQAPAGGTAWREGRRGVSGGERCTMTMEASSRRDVAATAPPARLRMSVSSVNAPGPSGMGDEAPLPRHPRVAAAGAEGSPAPAASHRGATGHGAVQAFCPNTSDSPPSITSVAPVMYDASGEAR